MKLLILIFSSALVAAILWALIGIVAGGFNMLQWHWGFRLVYALLMLLVVMQVAAHVAKD